ncbi:Crp/Fnr family transcriptional regulator [Reyranella sp.]|uniref:Crp/Fnr family transcriptional regulator n=1 Tax=Reyranella sp. TaxID=1929291 RepID=UPI00271EE300|nr:Crp/Fnr family transcriptional regulator [Reyranella sp.]MDO8975354.1 Crp/Fnr family transcriptional regulator [Reyranella sp.]
MTKFSIPLWKPNPRPAAMRRKLDSSYRQEDGSRFDGLFERHGWLAEQPAAFRREILRLSRPLKVVRYQWVFAIDDPPGGIYGVISGGIGIEGAGPFHTLRLGHVLRTGSWFGYHPILTGGRRRVQGMRAMEDSVLLYVPLPQLRVLVESNPTAARCIGTLANGFSILGTRVISDLLIPKAPQRIAAVLLRVTAAEHGVEPLHPDGFQMTQAELGEMSNVSRANVNRVLADFLKKGWISKRYQRLRVLDAPALRAFAATAA